VTVPPRNPGRRRQRALARPGTTGAAMLSATAPTRPGPARSRAQAQDVTKRPPAAGRYACRARRDRRPPGNCEGKKSIQRWRRRRRPVWPRGCCAADRPCTRPAGRSADVGGGWRLQGLPEGDEVVHAHEVAVLPRCRRRAPASLSPSLSLSLSFSLSLSRSLSLVCVCATEMMRWVGEGRGQAHATCMDRSVHAWICLFMGGCISPRRNRFTRPAPKGLTNAPTP
jgi:hypothetical protein